MGCINSRRASLFPRKIVVVRDKDARRSADPLPATSHDSRTRHCGHVRLWLKNNTAGAGAEARAICCLCGMTRNMSSDQPSPSTCRCSQSQRRIHGCTLPGGRVMDLHVPQRGVFERVVAVLRGYPAWEAKPWK